MHLSALGYENLYSSHHMSQYHGKVVKQHGFLTTAVNRPIIISNLVSVMRENIRLETDKQTLYEMSTFIKHDDGKSAAANGAHDDLVMASAIARFISADYHHTIIKSDTNEDFLSKNFSFEPKKETYLEW